MEKKAQQYIFLLSLQGFLCYIVEESRDSGIKYTLCIIIYS